MLVNNNLNQIITELHADLFYPKIGLELEFYLTSNDNQIEDEKLIDNFLEKISLEVKNKNLEIFKIEKEQGKGQIEIKTNPSKDINKICDDLLLTKQISQNIAEDLGLQANYKPTPFQEDCSNSMQINLSLLGGDDKNLFVKTKKKESNFLLSAIAGLLKNIKEYNHYFISSKEDISRFSLDRNRELFQKGKYTSPVNLCWGYNNRSCAIRVVDKEEENRRLEFRIADSNIDFKNAVYKFLKIVKHGIYQDLKAPNPIYGNAFDKKYQKMLRKFI